MLDFEALAKMDVDAANSIVNDHIDERIREFLQENLELVHRRGGSWTTGDIELALRGGDEEDNGYDREYQQLGSVSGYEIKDCLESN
ncbi:hypothetical protein VPHD148_0296 [Vibrio phage D148]